MASLDGRHALVVGKLDLDRLVSQTYPLEQINEAYADMLRGEGARGLVVF